MGNDNKNNSKEKDYIEEFRETLPRKMNVHVLSDNLKDCIAFVEYLTKEKFPLNSNQLLETDIFKKINLYSFMNYKIYESPDPIISDIKAKSKQIETTPLSNKYNYSEVIIILDNNKIKDYIKKLKIQILKDDVLSEDYYNPFVIVLSSSNLELNDLNPSKTFQYRTCLQKLLDFDKPKKEINNDIISNLGDKFKFINSEGKEIVIQNVDDINIPDFINIVFIGETGVGKSTLINFLLGEKKSIEGGPGLSTTSKNIAIYQKENLPLRFYDVKGIENEKSVQNQMNILSSPEYPKNAIFYLKGFDKGTIIEEMEYKLYETLIQFNTPILFIFTKCTYNPYIEDEDPDTNKARKKECGKMENIIKGLIKDSFKKYNKEEESEIFIKNYVRFYYINLLGDKSHKVKPFGIDKVLSFFTEAVSKDDWEKLKKSCSKCESENCQILCKNNFYLKSYHKSEVTRDKIKNEALKYLGYLKTGACITGWIPIADIGFEYLYRYKFKQKLKYLYGFEFEEANQAVENEERISLISNEDKDIKTNLNSEFNNIEKNIDEKVSNKARNTGSVIRDVIEAGLTVLKVVGSTGLKIASWAMLPATIFGCIFWSYKNIDKDCHEILDIFDKAYTPLRFKTLLNYINAYENAVNYLEKVSLEFKNKNK